MKLFIAFLFLSVLTFSGCNILGFKSDTSPSDSSEEEISQEESYTEEEWSEEDEEDEEEEEGEEDYEDEEEDYEDEEDDYEDEEDETLEEEEEDQTFEEEGENLEEGEKGGLRGFFKNLFSSSSEEEEGLEDEDNEFIGEDGNFAEGDRQYEDYEEYEESAGEDSSVISTEEDTQEDISPIEETLDTFSSAPEPEDSPEEKTEVSFIPLNKIISVPYKKAGQIVNAVYIARPGDSLLSISEKIYGSNQVSQLKQINSHLQSRPVTVGDKIYYNSPSRSTDSSQLLFYYQDMKIPSTSYQLSAGDNIRQVAYKLLGHPKSWKEIWATNPHLVSKGEITENLDIIYWPAVPSQAVSSQIAPSQPLQDQEMAPPEEPSEEPVLSQESQESAPSAPESAPESAPLAQEEPLSSPEEALPQENLAPPSSEKTAFPPPPSPKKAFPLENQAKKSLTDQIMQIILKQKEMSAIFFGIIILLILMIRLIIRKRRQKDFDYTATNIEL